MKRQRKYESTLLFAAVVSLAMAPAAFAGPPLICFPFDIGSAKSLPWNIWTGERSWNKPDGAYDTERLTDDAMAILTDSVPVIVRMETLRRAALYAIRDSSAGDRLIGRLKARSETVSDAASASLRTFDYGYFIETMKQAVAVQEARKPTFDLVSVDGYELIRRALKAGGANPQMEFAACIVSSGPRRPGYEEHFRNAVAGATGDELLSRNLISHFSHVGRNLSELQASVRLDGHR